MFVYKLEDVPLVFRRFVRLGVEKARALGHLVRVEVGEVDIKKKFSIPSVAVETILKTELRGGVDGFINPDDFNLNTHSTH